MYDDTVAGGQGQKNTVLAKYREFLSGMEE